MHRMETRLLPYRLTTAEITYRLPDCPAVLQQFIWQDFDLQPEFPVLRRFLDFWQRHLEGRLHSVRVEASRRLGPGEVRFGNYSITIQ
jgi:uncharacterized protein Usg